MTKKQTQQTKSKSLTKEQEYLQGWQRAQADYQNLKKEMANRQTEIVKFSNLALILQLLPIVDHFELAWQHIPANDQKANWVQGIGHIKKELTDLLDSLGVTEIKTIDEKFDPNLHEAVEQIVSDKPEGIIVEEIKAGYQIHGKVIVPAKVVVSNNEQRTTNNEQNNKI